MFSWDVAKALKNYEKHGVSFEEASTVFNDSQGLEWLDLEHSEDEPAINMLELRPKGVC